MQTSRPSTSQEPRLSKRAPLHPAQSFKRVSYDRSANRMEEEEEEEERPMDSFDGSNSVPSASSLNPLNSLNLTKTFNSLHSSMNPPDDSPAAERDPAGSSVGGFISARNQYILDQQRKYGKTAVPDKCVLHFPFSPELPAVNP